MLRRNPAKLKRIPRNYTLKKKPLALPTRASNLNRVEFNVCINESKRILAVAEEAHKSKEHALNHTTLGGFLAKRAGLGGLVDSNARDLEHYINLHTIMLYASKGKLQGKKVLHIAASTGVYARFLQDFYNSRAFALDINTPALKDAWSRGTRNLVAGSAIPERKYSENADEFEQRPSGLWVPKIKSTFLPFRDKSFDYLVSDHFLFADFHKEYANEKGFEERPGSMSKSEESLKEFNRILKMNGRIVVGHAHARDLPELQKYVEGFRINGFVVESSITPEGYFPEKGECPAFFVLRKVRGL